MEKEKDLSININQDVAKGTYSNLAIITHSNCEFVLDFASMLPGMPKPEVASRIIMTPEHAKRLFIALKSNIEQYESRFGEISVDDMLGEIQGGHKPAGPSFPMGGFGGNGAQS